MTTMKEAMMELKNDTVGMVEVASPAYHITIWKDQVSRTNGLGSIAFPGPSDVMLEQQQRGEQTSRRSQGF